MSWVEIGQHLLFALSVGSMALGLMLVLAGAIGVIRMPDFYTRLHAAGVTSFAQIAAWSEDDITRMDDVLSFKGRIARDNWVEQAKKLASGIETDFSKRAKKDDIYKN